MDRGLGKGLDSLIPNYYDEDFDSNNTVSLDDMLKENEDKSNEEDIVEDEIKTGDIGESSEDNIIEEESNVDTLEDNNIQTSQETIQNGDVESDKNNEESFENSETSEDVYSDKSSEDSLQSTQEIKRKENVAEVLDIVDKNPRITLWSSRSAAVFRYLRKTEPEFSISREASILIDEAVSKKYPHIWKLFEDI